MIIYLGESGDLGFDFNRRKTSKKFVITLLVCDNGEVAGVLRKAVRRTLKNKVKRRKGKTAVLELGRCSNKHGLLIRHQNKPTQ